MNRKITAGSRFPGEEGRGFFQDLALLLEPAHVAAQPAQLLALLAGQAVTALTGIELGLPDPVPERLRRHAELGGEDRDRLLRRAHQRDRVTPELLRIRRDLGHGH
jgi:hypothetical protein